MKSIASKIPYVGPAPRLIAPSEPTYSAEVIISALSVRMSAALAKRAMFCQQFTHQVKSIEHTSATCPVTFAHPVIQLAKAEYRLGANFAEK